MKFHVYRERNDTGIPTYSSLEYIVRLLTKRKSEVDFNIVGARFVLSTATYALSPA